MSFFTSEEYWTIVLDPIAQAQGSVKSATTTISGFQNVPNGFGNSTTQVPSTVVIMIATNAGAFASGDVTAAAATLLHELGHAYFALPQLLGGSKILPDGGNIALSQANQARILKDCF